MRSLVANALQFSRIVNATSVMLAVTKKAKDALRKIGEESPINALRVADLGIAVEGAAPAPAERHETP